MEQEDTPREAPARTGEEAIDSSAEDGCEDIQNMRSSPCMEDDVSVRLNTILKLCLSLASI